MTGLQTTLLILDSQNRSQLVGREEVCERQTSLAYGDSGRSLAALLSVISQFGRALPNRLDDRTRHSNNGWLNADVRRTGKSDSA